MNTIINKNEVINTNNICSNCEKSGHLFHQCKLPVISYGIVAFCKVHNEINYLMIRRKDSFGYIDFIRGKYSFYNIDRIKQCIDGMSLEEKTRLKDTPFETLWKMLWNSTSNQYKNEELSSSKKFQLIKSGVYINNILYTLDSLIDESITLWEEQEWEFPKGRKNYHEREVNCALREFEEETGISKDKLNIISNILPCEEMFIGSNHKAYKHKYYLAYLENINLDNYSLYQKAEVSKISWKTIHECINTIRSNNLEKITMIKNINKILTENRIYI